MLQGQDLYISMLPYCLCIGVVYPEFANLDYNRARGAVRKPTAGNCAVPRAPGGSQGRHRAGSRDARGGACSSGEGGNGGSRGDLSEILGARQ